MAAGAMRVRVAALTTLLAGCQMGALDPAGPVSRAEKSILLGSLVIMLTIVIPTIAAVFLFAWWFRASNKKATYRPDWEFSSSIEIVTWFVPLMVIILLGGVTYIGAHKLDPAQPLAANAGSAGSAPPVEIQVVSLDWKWLFIYPDDGVATLNELVIPAGVPIQFRITSSSVFNTFFVPRLGSMIYAMNGMATTLNLQADEPGTYPGMSGHFSGDGFSDMRFEVKAVPQGEYQSWLTRVRAAGERAPGDRAPGQPLDQQRYLALLKPEINVPAQEFALVDRNLFDKIVSLEIAPAPGPLSSDNKGVAMPETAR